MAEKELPALKLQQARENLEQQVTEVIREYDRPGSVPLQYELDLMGGMESDDERDPELRELDARLKTTVDSFHQLDIVRQTGIRVHKIAAIDSDSDGVPAVNVKFNYADELESGPAPDITAGPAA